MPNTTNLGCFRRVLATGIIINSDSKRPEECHLIQRKRPRIGIVKMVLPFVVLMKWNGYPRGGEKAALGRAWDKTEKSRMPVTRAQ